MCELSYRAYSRRVVGQKSVFWTYLNLYSNSKFLNIFLEREGGHNCVLVATGMNAMIFRATERTLFLQLGPASLCCVAQDLTTFEASCSCPLAQSRILFIKYNDIKSIKSFESKCGCSWLLESKTSIFRTFGVAPNFWAKSPNNHDIRGLFWSFVSSVNICSKANSENSRNGLRSR